jgi:phosphatidate cytidylyltransferase
VKRVLTAVILIPLVVIALFKTPLWLFTLLVLGVAVLATNEYLEIATATGFKPFRVLSYALLVWVFLAFSLSASKLEVSPFILISLLVLMVPLVLFSFAFLAAGMTRGSLSRSLGDAAVSFMLLPYIALPLVLIVVQRAVFGVGAIFVLYLMLMVWMGDIAAFYVGRAFGKHKLAPRVSPGKTWEGAIASSVGSVVVGLLLFRYTVPIERGLSKLHLLDLQHSFFLDASHRGPVFVDFTAPVWLLILFSLCINVAAQIGDLVESALKRGAGVKDSGTLLPGHGGVLDRIDALLFAIPVGWLFYIGGMQFLFRIV